MNFSIKRIYFIAISLPLFLFTSCTDDDDNGNVIEGTNSIVNYMETNEQYSLFAQAVERAGLSGRLNGNAGTYTFFGPTNTAMEAYLQENNFASVDDIPKDLAFQLVSNHILESLNFKDNFTTGYLKTLATVPKNDSITINMSLFVNANEDLIFNANTKITSGDIEVDNGVFHQINHVLDLPTLKTFLIADENMTPFYNKITEASIDTDFEEKVTSEESFITLFVPNENAVASFEDENITDADQLDNIYRNHLLTGLKISTDFSNGYISTQATENYSGNNQFLNAYINTQIGAFINNQATIVVPDIVGVNGVIHVTDEFIPLGNLSIFIRADRTLNTIVEAFTRDDQTTEQYLERLSEDSSTSTDAPFTVFAPDDNAFEEVLLELYPDQMQC
ncbi:fasciclin domain-containing protein [Mesonia maritima]|uniref:fasciclin domain-containing protein n=1 Tax=Mesonia maritima TaxID=1793873 RepID=UPI003644B409